MFLDLPQRTRCSQRPLPPSAGRDLDDKNHNRHVNIKIQGKEIEFGTKQPEGIEFEDNTTELTVETTDSKDKGFIKIRINPDNIDNNKDTYYIKTRE